MVILCISTRNNIEIATIHEAAFLATTFILGELMDSNSYDYCLIGSNVAARKHKIIAGEVLMYL